MSIIERLLEFRASPENPQTSLANPASWWLDMFDGGPTDAGVRINESNAYNISAVWAAIRVHTDALGQMPCLVYERQDDDGKRRAYDHPLYAVLHEQPNPYMTPFNFKEALQGHLLSWGNAYAEIEQDGGGRVRHLWPLLPDRTSPIWDNGQKWIKTRLPDNEIVVLPGERVLHIPGFGFDGRVGHSVISIARESLGLTRATERFGAKWFGSGSRPSGILAHPGRLSDKARRNMRDDWERMNSGLDNAHRVAILQEGVKWEQIGLPPDDSQFIETRKFQLNEVARWFRVPPHMIAEMTQATFGNIEHQSIEFVQYSISPHATRWEENLSLQLLTRDDRRTHFVEFLLAALLRGDSASRGEFYTKLFQLGAISPNEIRGAENLNPYDGGEKKYVPLNMIPIDEGGTLGLSPELPAAFRFYRGGDLNNGSAPTITIERTPAAALNPARRATQRSIGLRLRTRESFKSLFRSAAERVLSRELTKIRRALKATYNRANLKFIDWVDEFYGDFPETVSRIFLPVLTSYAESMRQLALDDLGVEGDLNLDERLGEFIREYGVGLGRRWTKSSAGQLRQLARDVADELAYEAIEQRLAEWEESRPAKVEQRETVQAGEAIVLLGYTLSGLLVTRWAATGDSCDLCGELDGMVVSVQEPFVASGASVNPEGETAPLTVDRNVAHPPLHDGCNCVIIPG